jgi:hypothetical protein
MARQIAFVSFQRSSGLAGFSLFITSSGGGGSERQLPDAGFNRRPADWMSQGNLILFAAQGIWNFWTVPVNAQEKPRPYLQTPFNKDSAKCRPMDAGSRTTPPSPAATRYTFRVVRIREPACRYQAAEENFRAGEGMAASSISSAPAAAVFLPHRSTRQATHCRLARRSSCFRWRAQPDMTSRETASAF